MSRLIDADRLNFVLEKNFGHTDGASVVKQLIDEQPTAYDLDKVMDKLNDVYDRIHVSDDEELGDKRGLSLAITIVKAGGKE